MQWLAAGLVYEWARGWSDGSLAGVMDDGHLRYAVRGGFRALADHLAVGVDVRLNTPVAAIERHGEQWVAVDTARNRYAAPLLLLTPPVPQSLALLDRGGVVLAAEDRHALERIDYTPCLCGLFLVEGEVQLPEPGAIQQPGAAVSWLADNQRKGISPEAKVITAHAGGELSRALWRRSAGVVLERLAQTLQPFLSRGAAVQMGQLIRWRYAAPTMVYPAPYLRAKALPPLLFAGDAFAGPRVEGAFLSGLAAASWLGQPTADH
jgi:predicted NAD/FAD-dependent oxidoreductase